MSEGPPWSPCVSVAMGGGAVPSGEGLEREASPQVTAIPCKALQRSLSFRLPCQSPKQGRWQYLSRRYRRKAGTADVRTCAYSRTADRRWGWHLRPGPCPDARCQVRGAPTPLGLWQLCPGPLRNASVCSLPSVTSEGSAGPWPSCLTLHMKKLIPRGFRG